MSPVALRGLLRSSRRRLTVALDLLGLAGAVGVHHEMPMDMHAMPGHTVCLALLGGAALMVAGVALATACAPRPRVAELRTPRTHSGTWCRAAPARAGPLHISLAVLRL